MQLRRRQGFARFSFIISLAGLLLASAPVSAESSGPFELQPMVGYGWIDVTGLSEDKAIDTYLDLPPDAMTRLPTAQEALAAASVPVEGSGLSVGLAAQLRLSALLLGVRYAFTGASALGLHTLGADDGVHFCKVVGGYFRLGCGYAHQTGLPEGMRAHGMLISGGTGMEFLVSEPLSVGIGLDADLLLLSQSIRSAVRAAQGDSTVEALRSLDGSAFGYQIRPQFHLVWRL